MLVAWSAMRLEVPCGVDQAEPGVEPVGVTADLVLEHFRDDPIVAVDVAVAGDDRPGELGVGLGQGVEAVADLCQGRHRHRFHLLRDRERGGVGGQLPPPP